MKFCVTPTAVFAGFAALLLAFVPFMYFWQGRDPDVVTNYVYCSMTYQIDEVQFTAMIGLMWVSFMTYFWFNFDSDVRKRLIIAGTIHVYFHYLLGRTYWRSDIHIIVLFGLVMSTVLVFVLSRRWNWFLIFAFVFPGVFAYVLISVFGGTRTEDEIDRTILWVYAISTHWPTFVFVFWLLVAPCMKERIARFDLVDKAFQFNSKKKDLML